VSKAGHWTDIADQDWDKEEKTRVRKTGIQVRAPEQKESWGIGDRRGSYESPRVKRLGQAKQKERMTKWHQALWKVLSSPS
jgi:hypothetical protein